MEEEVEGTKSVALIAAIKENKDYLGCEISSKYYEVALKRINNQLQTLQLF